MASATQLDLLNAQTYAKQRSSLLRLKRLYEKFPSIASKIKYNISLADKTNDYYYRDEFKNRAIMVDFTIDEEACNFISCVPWDLKGPCLPSDEAHYYRIGQKDEFTIACAPTCFHLKKVVYDDDGNAEAQFPSVEYNKFTNKCMYSSLARQWMETPITRSATRYERKLNDFEVGFDKVDDALRLNGYKYQYNKHYCDQFYASYRDGECYQSWLSKLKDAVIGNSLIHTATDYARLLFTGTTVQSANVDPAPEIESNFLKANYFSDINKNFKLPDVEIELDEFTRVKRDIKKNEKNDILKKLKGINAKARDSIHVPHKKPLKMKIDKLDLSEQSAEDIQQSWVWQQIQSLWEIQIEAMNEITDFLRPILTDSALWLQIGFDSMVFIIKYLSGKIGPSLMKVMSQMGTKLASKLISSTLNATFTRILINMGTKLVSKVVVAIGKLAALASSVIGILLVVVSVLDIVFAFWDPIGFNNQFPEGYLEELQTQYDFALREQTGTSNPEVTFDLLTSLMLEENDLLEITLLEFTYIYEYLNHLTVNSEGSRIDKGVEIELNPDIDADFENQMEADELKIYTQKELYDYENNFNKRYRTVQLLNFGAFAIVVLGILTIKLFSFISILLCLLGLLVFGFSYVCLLNDVVFDLPFYDYYDSFLEVLQKYNLSFLY